jgi:peptidoglycan hydrolase-like protein with peptidoglycan-binding domain
MVNSVGPDVKNLQIWLNTKGYTVSITGAGSKGNETTFFGNATVAALKKLQTAVKIPITGILDEVTKKYINAQSVTTSLITPVLTKAPVLTPEKAVILASLQKQLSQLLTLLQEAMVKEGKLTGSASIPAPVSTPAPVVTPPSQTFGPQNLGGQATPITSSSLLFPTNLWVNMQSPDVKRLQLWLNSHGFIIATEGPGSPGNESDRFGNATITALKKFQASVGVPQSGGLDEATRKMMK